MWQKAKNIYHLFQAILANIICVFPARKLTVIGVTGTDGKTTTASIIYHILKTAGKRVALISTVGAYIGDQVYDVGFHVTNPSTFPLQKFIRKIVKDGNKYLVLEVTSHGIDQNRVWGIPFKIGVLTNVTREHLDYHKTYESYLKTKIKLIKKSSIAVVNKDDSSWSVIKTTMKSKLSFENGIRKWGKNKQVILYSLWDKKADVTMKSFPFETPLIGDFNKSNCLAGIGATRALNIDEKAIRKTLKTFKTPLGRMETVYDKDFKVIIDFAHTPNAFASVLPEVKKMTKGRLIHVFGAAGKRDQSKRPEMGRMAAQFDDIIVLTAEDPRSENIKDINRQIKEGINKKFKVQSSNIQSSSNIKIQNLLFEVNDRREAIKKAISMAKEGDTVLLTGKAHEKSINYGQGEEPWDEFEETGKALISR